jgi:hypothetical protein
MSLTIDEAKLRESLATSSKPSYVVTASHLAIAKIPSAPTPSPSVGGTMMFGTPHAGMDMRDQIMTLRRKIEESGEPLKSAEELTKEIDEMRRRR